MSLKNMYQTCTYQMFMLLETKQGDDDYEEQWRRRTANERPKTTTANVKRAKIKNEKQKCNSNQPIHNLKYLLAPLLMIL